MIPHSTTKNIIFDFDGTILDTAQIILATMAETIARLGLPARSEEACRATIGLRLVDIPKHLYPHHPDISELYADTYRKNFDALKDCFENKLFDGVVPTLRTPLSRLPPRHCKQPYPQIAQ